jgi:predicted lipoprotein with Yx(FWY)xxD motif
MKNRLSLIFAAAALSVVALVGCSSNSPTPGAADSAASSASVPAPGSELSTAASSLGTIVVDGHGMTVYYYSKDMKGSGKSDCAGGCLALWPAVKATSSSPKVDGVTGMVGTITRDDGTLQVTIDGMPVYTYAQDSQAGDVNGEGIDNLWYVVSPDGSAIKGSTKSGY